MDITAHEQIYAQNRRYTKKTPRIDEFADRNGPIKVVKTKVPQYDKPEQERPESTTIICLKPGTTDA